MALLNPWKFSAISKTKNNIHLTAEATYTVFEMSGKTIFQIDIFGTNKRKNPEKVSQSIQIDKDMAQILINKLKNTFNLSDY